jgi:D-alanyl-D-alanine dipeptidase
LSETVNKQQQFTKMVADLIQWAFAHGYGLTFGEAYRPQWVADWYYKRGVGSKNSWHTKRMAVDLNLFDEEDNYLTATEDYEDLGKYWESIGGTWGGRFGRRDGNHFSLDEN